MKIFSDQLIGEIKALDGPIVIFGVGGFIGANLFKAILSVRNDCFGITHDKGHPWRLVDIKPDNIIWTDINNHSSTSSVLKKYSFKTIINLAAYGAYSKESGFNLIYNTNVVATACILEAAAREGFSAYIQAGSSSEYGLNASAPKEDGDLIPNSHYAVSKIASSLMVKYFGRVKKLPTLSLRLYSVYGPLEEPDRLIPKLIENGMEGKYPVLVNPDISRDFLYIDDVIEAIILSASVGVKKLPGGVLNIATGKKTTMRDIVQQIKELFDLKEEPQWNTMQNRRWDVKDWYGDPSYAKEILGWEAKASLKEGLSKTIAWTKDQRSVFIPKAKKAATIPKKISAIVACYNDAQAIPVMWERLTKSFSGIKVDYEIIFVNDSSPDNTNEVLLKIVDEDNHVIAIEHSRNFGSQSAFLSGMEISSGDAVILLDGDLQDPPEVIPELFNKWQEGFEVVYGRRVKRESARILNMFYKLFYKIFRGVSYIPIPLDAGDFSLIDRKVVNELLNLPETDQYLRGLRAWVGFKQIGVDYVRPERLFGTTTNNWRKNIWWAKKAIFSFSFVPLEFLGYLGSSLAVVSFMAIIWQILSKIFFNSVSQGLSTIIIAILFFGSIQMLAIAIIGEYLSKIFEETKKRPKYIRRSIRYGGKCFNTPEEIDAFIKNQR
ncbi:MAG: NAD-dependent epimerase/dehydratase family protein [bacterium]